MLKGKGTIWVFDVYQKWRKSAHVRKDIDVLLSVRLDDQSSFDERMNWALDLVHWIRSTSLLSLRVVLDPRKTRILRVKYLLNLLQSKPEWKKNCQNNFEKLLEESEAFGFLMNFGISSHGSFFADFSARLVGRWMPSPHEPQNLAYILGELFTHDEDLDWIEGLDENLFDGVKALFLSPGQNQKWHSLHGDVKRAIMAQAIQLTSLSLNPEIRKFLGSDHFQTTPFFHLLEISQVFDQEDQHIQTFSAQFFDLLEECRVLIQEISKQLESRGVSIALVYQLDLMKSLVQRMQTLMTLLVEKEISSHFVRNFIVQMMQENMRTKSLRALVGDNVTLLAKKIVESSAKKGHHYITRDRKEFLYMFKSALGGGALTALTTVLKFGAGMLPLSLFASGFLASLNYSISFACLQLLGWTLATKQPAMTAAALAAKMNDLGTSKGQENLVDEIVNILRSQFAAISGNILAVIPATLILCTLFFGLAGHHFLSETKAAGTIHSFSILGPTPFYAVLTGGILFLSSLVSGWTENWIHLRRIPLIVQQNRRLHYVFGSNWVQKLALFIDNQIPALAGSVALGFFLGMIPALGIFLGLPLDVRHVTLSTGSLVVASMNRGLETLQTWPFWLAVLGILSMAVFNLLVSFFLATLLAVRAQRITGPHRNLVFRKLLRRFKQKPLSFFLPSKQRLQDEKAH